MRWTVALAFVSTVCTSACFEDAPPVEDGGTASSTGQECVAGTEGCPCIEGSCLEGLSCLSNVCVDAGSSTSTSGSSSGNRPESTSSVDGNTVDVDVDSGVDTVPPPMTSDSSGELPPGEPCDPVYDQCVAEVSCVGLRGDGFYCEFPGPLREGQPCLDRFECGYHLTCVDAQSFFDCDGNFGCCTTFCDIFAPGEAFCQDGYFCQPYYFDERPPPGYEHVGVCVQQPG